MNDTQFQIDHLIELAVLQRAELKQLVDSMPQLRDHLSEEIERNLEEAEPAIRSELEQLVIARATDEHAKISVALTAKIDELAKALEITTAAKYSVLMAERVENANLLAKAEARIEDAASMLSHAVKEIVTDELSRFPRAGEIDQLRKEFAEPRGLNPRGRWMPDETYQRLDLVTINGDSFVSNIDGNRERPSRTAGDWTLSAARGNGGGGGGVTSMTDLVPVPSNGQLLIGNGSAFVNSTLTAGTGIAISNGAGSITISATDGNITLDDGTAAAPSLNFTNEPTTGLFRSSANVMGFAVNGVSRATMTTTGVTVTGTITPTGSVHAASGTVGNPSLAFSADQTTGLYRIGASNIGVAANGAKVLDIATTGLTVTGALGATSLTAPSAIDLTLSGGSTGASLVLGQGTNGLATITPTGTGAFVVNSTGSFSEIDLNASGVANGYFFYDTSTTTVGIGSVLNRAVKFMVNASEKARFAATTGNLLIGGTTDITGSGGLKVFGTTAASSTTSGALQVAGGVGVAGAGYFGGAVTITNTGSSGLVVNNTSGNPLAVFNASAADAGVTNNAYITIQTASTPRWYLGQSISAADGAFEIYGAAQAAASLKIAKTSGNTSIASTSASTGVGTGALQVAGGIYAGAASVFGAISSPGSGTSSERFGASASTSTFSQATAIGKSASVTGDFGTALGNAAASVDSGVALGYAASSTATYGIAIGRSATAAAGGTAVGSFNNAATYSIAIGYNQTAATGDIVLGLGNVASEVYIGQGKTAAADYGTRIQPASGNGAAVAGSTLRIAGGKGGDAATAGGSVIIQTAAAGTGTTLTDRLTISPAGAATFAGAVTVAGTVIHTLSATPASASATGTVGTMSWDASYIYICTATNTWKRVAIATW